MFTRNIYHWATLGFVVVLLAGPHTVDAQQPRERGRWKITIQTDYLHRDKAGNDLTGQVCKKFNLTSRGTRLAGNAELLARRGVAQLAEYSQLSVTQIEVTYTHKDKVPGQVKMSAQGKGTIKARATHTCKLQGRDREFVALNGESGVLGVVEALDFLTYNDSKGGLAGAKVEPGWLSVQLGPVSVPLTFSIENEVYEGSLDKADTKEGAAPVTLRLRSGISAKVSSIKEKEIATGGSNIASVEQVVSIDGKAVIAEGLNDTITVSIEDGFTATVTIDDADGKREFKLVAPRALTEDDKEKSSDKVFVGTPANRAWR